MKKGEKHAPKKARKKEKLDKIVQKELKEAEAEYTREHRRKTQTQILDSVFTTFFRVLTTAPDSPLLPTVLDGIALFTHLISVEFMTEIIRSIETFANTGASDKEISVKRNISVAIVFKSALVVFQAMKSQGYCIDVDVKDFYTLVYTYLGRCNEISLSLKDEETFADVNYKPDSPVPLTSSPRARIIKIALQTLELMICSQKNVPIIRVASFLKRLFMASLTFRPWEVQAVLQISTAILARFPKVSQLLSSETISGSGFYRPDVDEPDYANPFSSSLWELSILHNSYHPLLAKSVGAFLSSGLGRNATSVTFHYSPSLLALTSVNEWRGFTARAPIHKTKKNPRETPMDSKSLQRRQKNFFYPIVDDDVEAYKEQGKKTTFDEFLDKLSDSSKKLQLREIEIRMKNATLLFEKEQKDKKSTIKTEVN
jgi:nucleolar complex protein 3